MSKFPYKKINRQGRWQPLKLEPVSDGDPSKHPKHPYRPSDDENYLIQLAAFWKPHPPPSTQYYLERLPEGYGVFECDQPGGPQVYKRLFGHPSGRFYDSIQKFKPHFLWLMSRKQGECECQFCSRRKAPVVPKLPRAPREVFDRNLLRRHDSGTETDTSDNNLRERIGARRAPRRDQRAAGAPIAVDEEGTEDIYKTFMLKLYNIRHDKKGIDQDIDEAKSSMDWRAEHDTDSQDLLPNYLKRLRHQPSYLPRIGELVLWCQEFLDDHYLLRDNKSGQYKFFSYKLKRFSGIPRWRAGVVTTAPSDIIQNGPLDVRDILQLPTKATDLNAAGFRVETLPDPNNPEDKSASKQYKWLALRSIRPLAQWQTLLQGIPQEELHPSILNALTCATSLSLLEKTKATGQWPNCAIHCKAIHLGTELISAGDTVRLSSLDSRSHCSDILRVESIRLNLDGMKEEYASETSPFLASRSWISFKGKAYTRDPRRHYSMPTQEDLQNGSADSSTARPVPKLEERLVFHGIGAAAYGPWYHLHDPRHRYEVSHELVLGRLHEASAVKLWGAQAGRRHDRVVTRKADLSYDVGGITAAREYATQMDTRLPESQDDSIQWYWADTRALALGVESFNGLPVGKYWSSRDKITLVQWQEQIKILSGVQIRQGIDNSFVPLPTSTRGRKPGSKVINGKLVMPGDPEYEAAFGKDAAERPKPSSQMAGAAMVSTDEESGDDVDLTAWTHAEASKWKATEDASIEVYDPQATSGSRGSREPSLQVAQYRARAAAQNTVNAPPSKADIMAGGVMQSIEDDNSSVDELDEYDWPEGYVPPARGGTEESSGGDYDPKKDSRRRQRQGSDDW